jgi:hypothetical protein
MLKLKDEGPVLRRELEAMEAALFHSVDGTPRPMVPRRMLERAIYEVKRLRALTDELTTRLGAFRQGPGATYGAPVRSSGQGRPSSSSLYAKIARGVEREKHLERALDFYAQGATELCPGALARDVLDLVRKNRGKASEDPAASAASSL